MKTTSALRRITAAAVIAGTVAGTALIAGPANAAPTKPSSGVSIQSWQKIEANTYEWCMTQLSIAVALHRAQGNLISYDSTCIYSGWSHTWQAQVQYR